MFHDPFGGPPPLFTFFFIATAVIIVSTILYAIFKSMAEWQYNNQQPILSVYSIVKAKRTEVSGGTETRTSTYYYATFEVGSGDRLEFKLSGDVFGMIAEGDQGELTFQGRRFLGFERRQS